MPIRRDPKYKQLQFDTAIRNPERYKNILTIAKEFENKKLDDDCILDIICVMYRNGIIEKEEQNINFSLDEVSLKKKIIEKNKSRRADGGFPSGYQARFWTYMRTLSELGFIYSRYNDYLKISKISKLFVDNKINEQEAFSVQSLVYNRKSPYKNVSNDFNYFKFILLILLKMKEKSKKLSFPQFVLSLYSKSNDVDTFIKEITSLSFTDNSELLQYIHSQYNDSNREQTILRDYPDVVLRILRIMGFITIYSYDKLYISINEINLDYINDLLRLDIQDISEEEKYDALKYYNRSNNYGTIFENFINTHKDTAGINPTVYKGTLNKLIDKFKIDEKTIINLISLVIKSSSSCPITEFKFIPEPLKLEFYISILLNLKFSKNMLIRPNYRIDDMGIPISHAPGNIGDIEVFNNKLYWLIEVTLIKNKTQQYNSETSNVIRHLCKINTSNKRYLSFVAPIIHEDTEDFYNNSILTIKLKISDNDVYIKPYSINNFIESMNSNIFEDMENYTNSVILQIKEKLEQ